MRMRLLPGAVLIAAVFVAGLQAAGGIPVRLIDAVKAGNRSAVRTLIAQHTNINAAEPDGMTATVIGACQFTLQASGDTVYASDESMLPVSNVPVISVLAALIWAFAASDCAFGAETAAGPNFAPDSSTGWLALDDEFIPPPSGPGWCTGS